MTKAVRVVVEVWGTVLTDGHVWVEYTATAGLPLPSPADQLSQSTRPPEVDRRLRELIGRIQNDAHQIWACLDAAGLLANEADHGD
ncbi:hypothetical protein [Hydrocarboniphaga effusa]|jgi:hypothetical protein|uniref:hypothetical protein n=1 Tax=Hydrocarboniphaga effusa TaxID=243629 RepID=UPI00398BD053